MSNTAKATVTPATVENVAPATVAVVKAATYAETATVTLTDKGKAGNPKRAASAARYAIYLAAAAKGETLTVKAYLDAAAALHLDEPRYRWRADFAWDVKRGLITVA